MVLIRVEDRLMNGRLASETTVTTSTAHPMTEEQLVLFVSMLVRLATHTVVVGVSDDQSDSTGGPLVSLCSHDVEVEQAPSLLFVV